MGTSSFAASHISHQAAVPASLRPPPESQPSAAARSNGSRPSQRAEPSKQDVPFSNHSPGSASATAAVHSQSKEGIAPKQADYSKNNKVHDTAKGARETGESVSPQESCVKADTTADRPPTTAGHGPSLKGLNSALRSKKAQPFKRNAQPELEDSRYAIAGATAEPNTTAQPQEATRPKVIWSKSGAKGAFDASNLDPALKEVIWQLCVSSARCDAPVMRSDSKRHSPPSLRSGRGKLKVLFCTNPSSANAKNLCQAQNQLHSDLLDLLECRKNLRRFWQKRQFCL